jgi:ribosomal protein S27AE
MAVATWRQQIRRKNRYCSRCPYFEVVFMIEHPGARFLREKHHMLSTSSGLPKVWSKTCFNQESPGSLYSK